jgi:hypothetical protein
MEKNIAVIRAKLAKLEGNDINATSNAKLDNVERNYYNCIKSFGLF